MRRRMSIYAAPSVSFVSFIGMEPYHKSIIESAQCMMVRSNGEGLEGDTPEGGTGN